MWYGFAVIEALRGNLEPPLIAKDPGWSPADSTLFPEGTLIREVGQLTFTLEPQKDGFKLTAVHCGLDNAGAPHELSYISQYVDGKNHANSCIRPMAVELLTKAVYHMVNPGPG